ncbi:adaptor protein MecA [Lederbergia sp. NSJ-179]|uniref:adaptor protein MecA n=1 Tax=Lederbergia sp. NSJ-179 TaxID=2931402 RepID=UPI001FD1CF38|nr:adaptor protein MecA [Lederbergia sp. NSJ-179]MCJ7839438.1 adaptor protein MecA [Lederbergia sp. NSJ-179]
MRLERIALNQIKYSISIDELTIKGFTEEEMLKEPLVWDALFDEMLDEASRIYNLETCEAMSVEIYSMNHNELVLILTLDEEDLIDPKIGIHAPAIILEQDFLIFSFDNIEDCIFLAKRLIEVERFHSIGSLYALKDRYYLVMMKGGMKQEAILALGEEYGERSTVTWAYLEEYGTLIIDKTAIQTLNAHF